MPLATAWKDVVALARSRLPVVLADMLGISPSQVRLKHSGKAAAVDFVLAAKGHAWLVDVLGRPSAATLSTHWNELRRLASTKSIPILAVPFMTDAGQVWSRANDVNWVDFSGNAQIRAPGLHIHVVGNANAYAKRGRPSSVFERRSSRVARTLLQHPGRVWSVRECARATGLDDGHVSRILGRLAEDQLVSRDEQRRVRVPDAGLLLDAWRDAAQFGKHRVLAGHVAARSGDELLRLVSSTLTESKVEHAATGLGAAWLYNHFAMFRLTTCYVREWPTPELLERLHFREASSGANTWLVLPTDDGVFEGAQTVDGVPCVHPVQVYVDLKGQPERAVEAAKHLRENRALLGLENATP